MTYYYNWIRHRVLLGMETASCLGHIMLPVMLFIPQSEQHTHLGLGRF